MKAVARRGEGYVHEVEVDGHSVTVDEPVADGGNDRGPSPTRLLTASLAACTAITVEMYAERKGWDVGPLEVEVEGDTGPQAHFEVILKLPTSLDDEQVKRLTVIAGKCPVHRTLVGEVEISDRVERV